MDPPGRSAPRPEGKAALVAAAIEGPVGEPHTLGEFLAQMEAKAQHQERTFGRALAKRETNRLAHLRRVLFGGDRSGGGNGGLVSRVLGALEVHGPLPEVWATHVGEALLIELGLADASAAAKHAHQRFDVGTGARIDHHVELLSEHASDGTAWCI
jgi:hypothetical protein